MARINLTAAFLLVLGCSSTDTDADANADTDADADTDTPTTDAASSGDAGSEDDSEDDSEDTGDVPETLRGVRTCELNELVIMDGAVWMRVWNEVGMHDCPDDWLASIDSEVYAVGGPRWRSIDTANPLGGTPDFGMPQEVPAGLGYPMVEAAAVELFPVSVLEGQLGAPIETLDDIPLEVRRTMLDTTLFSTQYVVAEVDRVFTTEFVHFAGQRVFIIDDGECQYAMKYYTSIIDAELVDEDAVATLGDRFTQLPEGFSFSVQTFDEDLVIREDEGLQYVLTDEFGNSYDRFACD